MNEQEKCPYCGELKMYLLETEGDETYTVCKIKKNNVKHQEFMHVKMHVCTNCGGIKFTGDFREE